MRNFSPSAFGPLRGGALVDFFRLAHPAPGSAPGSSPGSAHGSAAAATTTEVEAMELTGEVVLEDEAVLVVSSPSLSTLTFRAERAAREIATLSKAVDGLMISGFGLICFHYF